MAKKKSISVVDFYKDYPYPVARKPDPFVPKRKHTKSKYTISYEEWRHIIDVYTDVLQEYLMEGKTYRMFSGVGKLVLKKGHNHHNRKYDSFYYAKCKWLRRDEKMYWKNIWRFRIYDPARKRIAKRMREDPDFAMKLSDLAKTSAE